MHIDKGQLKAINIYLLYQITYPEDLNIVLKRQKKNGIVNPIKAKQKESFNIEKYLNYNELNNQIKKFYYTLKTYLPHVSLSAFENNIKTLRITSKEKSVKDLIIEMLHKEIVGAEYDSNTNKIIFYPQEYEKLGEDKDTFISSAITHELLHMASSYKKGLIRICGFSQTLANSYEIGYGINEGFTEYLNCKYFNQKAVPAYEPLQNITKIIAEIVGVETMEKLYFQGNLKGLVNELSKYQSQEQSLDLIYDIDKAHRELNSETKQQLLETIKNNLSNLYIKKQETQQSYIQEKRLEA